MRIRVENEGGTCDDYLLLIDAIGHPSVGATLDIGHCADFEHVIALGDATERGGGTSTRQSYHGQDSQ